MKISTNLTLATYLVLLVSALLTSMSAWSQGSTAPVLSITPRQAPEISVNGLAGARYQLEFSPSLSASNWQALTNFILGASPYTVVDSNAPLVGIRMYRALLLETNATVSYAPTTLKPAVFFRFSSQNSPNAINDILVLNSATNGVLVRQDNSPNGGISLVNVSYNRLGPFLAAMSVIRPPSSGFPGSQTNSYTLVFTGPGSGFFQVSDGVMIGTVGEFSSDQSLVGQQIAPVHLSAGEGYSLLATNFGGTNRTTLVINSATSGMLITSGNVPSPSITPVSIEYQLLGPLSSQLQVVIPAGNGFPTPQTNSYYFVYTSISGGVCQSIGGDLIPRLGPFTRDQSLVGQQIAPPQLTAGESYRLLSTSAGMTNLTTLVINSATSGMLIVSGNMPSPSITSVSLEYQVLGPLSSHLQVVIPASNGFPTPQTNWYYLVYAATNSGSHQSVGGPAIAVLGSFTRDQSLVGQQIAPLQLTAGESYRLLSTNFGFTNLTTLVISSATSGMLIAQGNTPSPSITPVSLEYQQLGPLSSQLQVVIPASDGFPMAQTNWYYLVYAATNSGSYHTFGGPAIAVLGSFTRDQSLVGQQIAPLQLTAGESYRLLSTNAGMTNLTTLVINSTTRGMLISSGNPPPGSIALVSIEYQQLGPLSSQLQVIVPPGNGLPDAQTNRYYCVYTTANSGAYQSFGNPMITSFGAFTRDQSLMGQQIAAVALIAGENYSLLSTNAGITNLSTLVINSPTSGMLVSPGNPPPGSIALVSLEYQLLGPLSSRLQVILPPGNGFPVPKTNWYYFVYATADSGSFQSIAEPLIPSIGPFVRDRTLVGQQIAPPQLTVGESYHLTAANGPVAITEALIINSPTNGIFVSGGDSPEVGIFPNVAFQYLALGSVSAQIQVVIPPTPAMLTARTNSYLLVYTGRNSGRFQRTTDPAIILLGEFLRNF